MSQLCNAIVAFFRELSWIQIPIILIAAETLIFLISYILPKIVSEEKTSVTRFFLQKIRAPLWMTFGLIIAYWGISKHAPDSPVYALMTSALPILLIISFSFLLLRLSSVLFDRLKKKFNVNTSNNLKARKVITQIQLIERVISFIIITISIAAALMSIPAVRSYGTSLLASAGIAGLVLGIAAQQTLGNILAGIQIAITQPLRYDDAVIIDNEWGWIEEITLTYIVVRIWDKRRLIVPISQLLQKSFQNWTRSSSSIIGSVVLHLDYRADIDLIRKEQDRLLAETDLWDKDVNVVQLIDTTEYTIVVRTLVSAQDSPTAWDLRCLIREKLILYLQKEHPDFLPKQRHLLESPEK
jgi:small-conductance mechanosensitive channel